MPLTAQTWNPVATGTGLPEGSLSFSNSKVPQGRPKVGLEWSSRGGV